MTSAWGGVDPEIELTMPSGKVMANARIQLARHVDGRWMWATEYFAGNQGSGYWVAAKWNNFADCIEAARGNAITEIRDQISGMENSASKLIASWLVSLDHPTPQQRELFA